MNCLCLQTKKALIARNIDSIILIALPPQQPRLRLAGQPPRAW
jgi:hypothetical protein